MQRIKINNNKIILMNKEITATFGELIRQAVKVFPHHYLALNMGNFSSSFLSSYYIQNNKISIQ